MSIESITESYAETTRLDLHELVRRLNQHLGATLVATLANVNDRKLPYRWARAETADPNPSAATRLRMAHRVWLLLADSESDDVARAWFIGENPHLDERAPVLALREGDGGQVMRAAQAFVTGSFAG